MKKQKIDSPQLNSKKEKTKIPALAKSSEETKKQQKQEEGSQNWEEFEEITKGNFNKLLGCG